jgi:hypothetical protein
MEHNGCGHYPDHAEAKLGELLKEIPPKPIADGSGKGTFGGREQSLPEGITKKQSHYAQELAEHPEVIESVIQEAKDKEEIPTRYDALKAIQQKKIAAQIAGLDLVVSVDNSTVHMAGALGGVPVWVLLPYVCDWRWMLDRSDSPWYPTMRLFRQPSAGNWDEVIAGIKLSLLSLITHFKNGITHERL